MWRVIVALVIMGLLSGCNDMKNFKEENSAAIPLPFGGRMHRMCIDGYEFLATGVRVGANLVQFWELGADGQPRPRVCGGDNAE